MCLPFLEKIKISRRPNFPFQDLNYCAVDLRVQSNADQVLQ